MTDEKDRLMQTLDVASHETLTDPAASTVAVRRALAVATRAAHEDLLFFEAWERFPTLGGIQRVRQLRRANPALAAELRAELEGHRRSIASPR